MRNLLQRSVLLSDPSVMQNSAINGWRKMMLFIVMHVLILGKRDRPTSSRAAGMFFGSFDRSFHEESNEAGSFTMWQPINPAFSNLLVTENEVQCSLISTIAQIPLMRWDSHLLVNYRCLGGYAKWITINSTEVW